MTCRFCCFLILSLATPAIALSQSVEPTDAEIAAFVTADRDANLLLTRAEFKTFVREMAKTGQPTARQIRNFGAYGLAFRITDINKDGVVSPEEMRAADKDHRSGLSPTKP